MDDEEQRDALLFGQENPFENEEKAPNDTVKTSSEPSSRYAMIAIAIATVLLALMVVYRPDSIDERVNTLNQLLRIGTGDSKGFLPPVNSPMDKASPSDMMTTPLAPMMTQTVMKMSDVAPGASLSPPVPKSTTVASNVMSSSYNNQAGIATAGAGAMASSSSSITNTMQAGKYSIRLLLLNNSRFFWHYLSWYYPASYTYHNLILTLYQSMNDLFMQVAALNIYPCTVAAQKAAVKYSRSIP